MDEVFDLTYCSSCFVRKSTLLHKPEVQYNLDPKLIHYKWQKQSPPGLKTRMFFMHGECFLLFRLVRADVFAFFRL